MPVEIMEWPFYFCCPRTFAQTGKTIIPPDANPFVKVRISNEHRDTCYWPPDWVVKQGQNIPLFRGVES